MPEGKLLYPTNEIIDKFNDFWFVDNLDEEDYYVSLFNNNRVNIKNYIKVESLLGCGEADGKINDLLKKGDVTKFLAEINSVYHTRVGNLKNVKITLDELEKISFDDFMLKCKECSGRNEYSFVTKVFSFLNPDKYPIIDRLSVTLLWEYLNETNKKDYPKSGWGDYSNYIKAYNAFIQQYNIKESFKKVDVFLWTYAILLQSYWEIELGIFRFESVTYSSVVK